MASIVVKEHPGVQRCAVCKIDRKGRFILADPMAQDLFGLGEVELFGRALVDFVDPPDHAAIETMTTNRNPYETVFDAASVTLLDNQQNRFNAILIISVNFGGGNPANYQVIICTDRPASEDTSSTPGQAWLKYLEYLSDDEQIEAPDMLAEHLVALDAVASATIYQGEVNDENLLAQCVSDSESHNCEPNVETRNSSEHEVRAIFGLASGKSGLAIMTLAESDLEMDVVRGQADLAAIVLHALCPEASDRTEHGFDTEVKSASRLLDQLQIGALEIDCDGHIRHHNEVFDQLFDSPAGLDSLADLIDLMEARSDKSTAASVAAYFRASSGSVASPALRLNFCLPQIGTVALTFERANPGSNDLSGCFLFSRVDARLAAGSEAFSAPIDLTLAGLDRLRSSMSAARSIWLKLEHEHHNELSRHGGFYLRGLSHHLDAVEQTLIDLEQLLSVSGTTEEPQKVNIDLVVDRIVVDLQTSHTGLSLNVRHTDLPSVTGQLHKITAALRHAMSASVARAEGAEVDISISAELADGNCSITLHDNGARMTRKQIRRAFDYVGPATADRDRTRGNRPVGLAQARALIRSMGGRMGLVPDGAGGTGVKMVFPEA